MIGNIQRKCECCGKKISIEQWNYCHLCGLCDTGACQRPKVFHELERKYNLLFEKIKRFKKEAQE